MADYLFDFPNTTMAGADELAASMVTQIPILPALVLFSTYFIIVISGSLSQSFKRGYIDLAMWSMFGMLTIDLMALVMTLASGIISPIVLGVCFGLTILNGFWFFLTFGRFEQQ